MAKLKIVMPQMGESITTGTITKWNKAPGDIIELDETLLEISTDKVESEIPSPYKGRVEALLFKEGDTVDVGVAIAEIEDDLSVSFSGGSSASASASADVSTSSAGQEETGQTAAKVDVSVSSSTSRNSGQKSKRFYTPLVKSLAQKHGVDLTELDQIEGSGLGGRVNKKDFEHYLSQRKSAGSSVTTTSSPAPAAASVSTGGSIEPSDRVEIIPMDNMRKAIAKNMVLSKQTSPHVNSLSEVDLTHLVHFRNGFKDQFFKKDVLS